MNACMSTSPQSNWQGGALDNEELFVVEGLLLLLMFGTRLDVCVWSLHNGRCTQSTSRALGVSARGLKKLN